MAQKIKAGAVSYLNTKPLIYGFEIGMMKDEIELLFDYPANIAAQLLDGRIDIGLVPVTVLAAFPEYHIIGDHCIGCDGEVASVCLFSDVPLEKIKTVLLDYQSNTSVALLRILLKKHWHISPVMIAAEPGYEKNIGGSTAGLIIGDRAFTQRNLSKYCYDLGMAWKEMTTLPFVFAAWVSSKALSPDFIAAFNMANEKGLNNLDKLIEGLDFKLYDLHHYYAAVINYRFDEAKKEGMELFLKYISNNDF